MTKRYDVIIVGGGPAGIFAALELRKQGEFKVLLLEKGRDIDARHCPVQERGNSCISCDPCHMVSGWGGAGAFSDGKLSVSADIGGHLKDIVGPERARDLVSYVDELYLRFGAPKKLYGVGAEEQLERLRQRAALAELRLVPVPFRHLGTEYARKILKEIQDYLSPWLDIRLRTSVASILTNDGMVTGVETSDGDRIGCQYLVLAPGREGADWLVKEAGRLHLKLDCNPIDVGVRVEVPAPVLSELTSVLYESKLEYSSRSFDDHLRTFCMCPSGEVTMESTGGENPVITVNGHSYAERKTQNTNFAILVSTTFTEPFKDPIAYGKCIARLANLLSGGVLVQRLGDLREGHRSTRERLQRSLVEATLKSAVPGDLSFVLPYRHLKGIIEMLDAMDRLAPGVASRHTLLYGVEVKFYSPRLDLTSSLETELTNMFAIGDAAGVSRGLVQASASGVLAAREILRKATAESRSAPGG
ncbi:MAG: NAD(P)/FAD-dependent oxidoreductase [Chloroflexi bacterium]|nr:NAD(P)/FAD-dependent oxidoreductase [Chloroflexota bacterium]